MYYLDDYRDGLYVAGIENDSVVDGPGLRTTIFLQGCDRACKGCHNPETWDHSSEILESKFMSFEDILNQIKLEPYSTGITISGGEPVLQAKNLNKFIKLFKKNIPNKTVFMYTGYTLSVLQAVSCADDSVKELLENIDELMDGPFIEERKSLEAIFRGSTNQTYYKKNTNQGFEVVPLVLHKSGV